MTREKIRIGTRSSDLALAQAEEARDLLCAAHDLPDSRFEIVPIETAGDRIKDKPLAQIGGKGLFAEEIEKALRAGGIQLAVHSVKDMAAILPQGLELTSFLPRQDARDAFVSPDFDSIAALPQGAKIGSSSVRRAALLRRMRPDLDIVPFRGNVPTRLEKLAQGQARATVLAVAGLNRLEMQDRITAHLPFDSFLPSPGQGAIGLEIRADDESAKKLVQAVNHAPTHIEITAERAFLAALGGSCSTPIAGLARLSKNGLSFQSAIFSLKGDQAHEWQGECAPDLESARALGQKAGEILRDRAGDDFFKTEFSAQSPNLQPL